MTRSRGWRRAWLVATTALALGACDDGMTDVGMDAAQRDAGPGPCAPGPENNLATCTDGCSNDDDGLVDCADPDCVNLCDADAGDGCVMGQENTDLACGDGCSNDGDRFIDCDDFDCAGRAGCPGDAGPECTISGENTAAACSDGCSNDGDRFVDCEDFDCAGIAGCPTRDAGQVDAGACTRSCAGRACGDDGCGGSCGSCPTGRTCNLAGQCISTCTPMCPPTGCGTPDGCGGSCGCAAGSICSAGQCIPSCCGPLSGACGTCAGGQVCPGGCPAGRFCDSAGACQTTCTPSCTGRSCGSDGCGGSCGTCPTGALCAVDGTCYCDTANEWFPNQARTACVRANGRCTGVTTTGHCVGNTWVWCDPSGAGTVEYMDCVAQGLPGCNTVTSSGGGACACGPVGSQGVCGGVSNEYHFYCLTGFGVLAQSSCRQHGPSGFCSTYVGAFGHQTQCFCSTCNFYDALSRTCMPLCSGCRYDSAANFHTCPI